MGYITYHRIRIINEYNTTENLEELKEYIEKISGYYLHIDGSVIYDNGYKWYECENNMIAVSKFFPDYEIQVKGKGEEGEIWECIFHDGDCDYNDPSSFTDNDSDSDSEDEIYIEINKQKYIR